jgi:hypothetical protein
VVTQTFPAPFSRLGIHFVTAKTSQGRRTDATEGRRRASLVLAREVDDATETTRLAEAGSTLVPAFLASRLCLIEANRDLIHDFLEDAISR